MPRLNYAIGSKYFQRERTYYNYIDLPYHILRTYIFLGQLHCYSDKQPTNEPPETRLIKNVTT